MTKSLLTIRTSIRMPDLSAFPSQLNKEYRFKSLSSSPLTFTCAVLWAESLWDRAVSDGGYCSGWDKTHLTTMTILVDVDGDLTEHIITGDLNGHQYGLLCHGIRRFTRRVPEDFRLQSPEISPLWLRYKFSWSGE